ncbi:MAG: DotU family type IV/VI secretion system protein [Planctomycetia bacterium]|nr:DotU family type IV/VI secretion system protein [Planctomycetia bacterium]
MQDETAATVHDVIGRGLDLKRRLERGETPALANEQAALEQVLSGGSEANRYTDLGTQLEIRYALVCWLDEVFVLDPVWGTRWNEHKLEVSVFGTNDRAWMFWEKARRASGRTDTDVLEVYYLCVLLGFRGELRDDPAKLQAWTSVARAQIEKGAAQGWTAPPELDPPGDVPPLKGRDALQTMMVRCGVALMLLIPVAAFLVVLRVGR